MTSASIAIPLLTGKKVLVTGSTRGIGRGIAQTCGSAGASVFVTGRDPGDVESTVNDLRALGITAAGVAADLLDPDSGATLVQTMLDQLGGLDVLVNNAGIYPEALIEDMTIDQWRQVIDTNLTSAYVTLHASAPHFKQQASGRIIEISSITGTFVGYPGHTHYAATKAALNGFMRAAALELAPFGVTVNCVAPGSIETPGLAELGLSDLADFAIPMKRLGTPEDIGWAVAFLGSDLASFITGHTLVVDGGQIVPEVQGRP